MTLRITNLQDSGEASSRTSSIKDYLEASSSNGFRSMYTSLSPASSSLSSVSVQYTSLSAYAIDRPSSSDNTCVLDAQVRAGGHEACVAISVSPRR